MNCHYCGIPLVPKGRAAEFCEVGPGGSLVEPPGMAFATDDHKIPRSLGGSNRPENLVPACRPCNSRKGTRRYEEFVR